MDAAGATPTSAGASGPVESIRQFAGWLYLHPAAVLAALLLLSIAVVTGALLLLLLRRWSDDRLAQSQAATCTTMLARIESQLSAWCPVLDAAQRDFPDDEIAGHTPEGGGAAFDDLLPDMGTVRAHGGVPGSARTDPSLKHIIDQHRQLQGQVLLFGEQARCGVPLDPRQLRRLRAIQDELFDFSLMLDRLSPEVAPVTTGVSGQSVPKPDAIDLALAQLPGQARLLLTYEARRVERD